MAQWTGALPRYLGSSDPCMFSAPQRGTASPPRRHPFRRIGIIRCFNPQFMRLGKLSHAAEPAALAGIIGMREQQGNLHALRQHLAHTANADFAVGEYHRTSHWRRAWLCPAPAWTEAAPTGTGSPDAPSSSSTASTM